MQDFENVTFRWGKDPHYLNIDYNGREIGHLTFDNERQLATCGWASYQHRDLVRFPYRLAHTLG